MKWLAYTLTPLGSVSAGKSREIGFDRPAYEVLPGSVIRGALGAAWWAEQFGDQPTFDAIFESQLTVHAAIPSLDGESARLYPLGWSRRKYPADSPFEPLRPMPAGTHVPGRGWSVPSIWMTAATRTQLREGVAVDRALFTRRAAKATVVYSGHLALDAAASENTVEWLIRGRRISIGGQRSVMGRCSWRCEVVEDPHPVPNLKTVAVTALQPIILVDEYGANSLDLSAAIRAVLATVDPDAAVTDLAARPVAIGGWHGRAGFPKPTEWALDAGAWALVHSTRPAEAWSQLREGLGVRRVEGYGALVLTAPDERPEFAAPLAVAQGQSDIATDLRQRPVVATAPAEDLGGHMRRLIEAIPPDSRPDIVHDLLGLAREAAALDSGPMGGMRISRCLDSARQNPSFEGLSPEMVDAVLALLRTRPKRTPAIDVLEELS